MRRKTATLALISFSIIILLPATLSAQNKKKPKGELYLSWGYNTEWYTKSNIRISQPSLGNDYTFNHIKGHDRKGWDNDLFKKGLSIPQYNYRLGYIFNPEKGWGFEINFDHTKFIVTDGQDASVTGKLNGRQVDTTIRFSEENGFFYYLNNGANFLLFNVVKRYHIIETRDENFKLDFRGKAGVGPVIPHVENSFFGNKNKPHFQLGGWNMGVEATLRATFFKFAYLEYANKLDYARYSGLKIYEGKAKQAFGTYEMILSIGANVPIGKRVK
jgi:hypothetical protein